PPEKYTVPVPPWVQRLERGASKRVLGGLFAAAFRPSLLRGAVDADGRPAGLGLVIRNLLAAMLPVALVAALFAAGWWYVIIHNAPAPLPETPAAAAQAEAPAVSGGVQEPPAEEEEKPTELGAAEATVAEPAAKEGSAPQQMGSAVEQVADASVGKVPENFYAWFWGLAALAAITLVFYYSRMDGEQLEILKLLAESVVPLGLLTFVVLAVILFGITTASESAGIGAAGALYLASFAKYQRSALWSSLAGGIVGVGLGTMQGGAVTLIVSGSLGALFAGTAVPWFQDMIGERKLLQNIKESTFLTAKTTALVCWLFVGSALFSAVFALHGGQQLVEKWVLALNMTPLQFLILSQAIIFILGWPLEWTEIIVIFVPIFIPLLAHFNVDPILFGTMVAVNLQAAFLSPPVAMSAFYLKGVAPRHVTLNQIFAGMMPYMLIVCLCLAFMYIWPGMTLWLPEFLYGN